MKKIWPNLVFAVLSMITLTTPTNAFSLLNAGTVIHTVYVNTEGGEDKVVTLLAQFGQKHYGKCIPMVALPIPALTISDNTSRSFTNQEIKQYLGKGYTCANVTISNDNGTESDVFDLTWDGVNYIGSTPAEKHLLIK